MVNWEYCKLTVPPSQSADHIDILNKFGADGWELVSVIRYPSGCEGSYARDLYFKRKCFETPD